MSETDMAEPAKYNLREKRKAEEPEVPQKKKRKTSKEYQQDYRDRIKANPEKYKVYREYETARVKLFKHEMGDETRKKYNETTKIRVKRNRAANKSKLSTRQKTPKTRRSTKEKRTTWKNQKKDQRAKRTPQAKSRENEKRRKKYAEKKEREKQAKLLAQQSLNTPPPPPPEGSSSSCSSEEAIRKAVFRAEQGMPKEENSYNQVLGRMAKKLVKKLQKKKQTEEAARETQQLDDIDNGIITTPHSHYLTEATAAIKEQFKILNGKRNKRAMKSKRILAVALSLKRRYLPGFSNLQRQLFGTGKSLIKDAAKVNNAEELDNRKKRSDALSDEIVDKVEQFYLRGDISRDLPDARSAKKEGGSLTSRKVLDLSLRCAYDKFTTENPSIALSFSKFKQLRPQHVLTYDNNKRAQCLCEYCVNIAFKIESLSRFMAAHQLGPCPIKDKYGASRLTLCPKDNATREYKKSCLNRECSDCGTHLLNISVAEHGQSPVNWYRWENQEFAYNDRTIRRMTKAPKTGTVLELLDQLREELGPFAKHLFNASWQWRQYDIIAKDVPANWVVFCMDYAENYACKSQDEAQGAHWNNVQATIHPVVASYRCTEDDCDKIVTDTIMFISNDIKHCYHGVQHFNTQAIKLLRDRGIEIERLIHFTDGAPTQYKSRINFADVSLSGEDFGFPTEKHFFGSRHGKGPCDREIGVLKKQVVMAINAHQVNVRSPRDLYWYGKSNLSRPKTTGQHVHEKREFIYVQQGEINRIRPDRFDVKPVAGTQQLHCIRGAGAPFKVEFKERSCFCQICIGSGVGECKFADLTGGWTTATLKKHHNTPPNVKTNEREQRRAENRSETEPTDAPPLDQASTQNGSEPKTTDAPPLPLDQASTQNGSEPKTTDAPPQPLNQASTQNGSQTKTTDAPPVQESEHDEDLAINTEIQLDQASSPQHQDNLTIDESPDKTSEPQAYQFSTGDFVVVVFENAWYPASVVDVGKNKDMATLHCMDRMKKKNKFVWEKNVTSAPVSREFILCKIDPGKIIPDTSLRYFSMDSEDIAGIDKLYQEYALKYFAPVH